MPILAKRRTPHGSGLGKTRWVVERTLAWLHKFRKLRIRDERHPSGGHGILLRQAERERNAGRGASGPEGGDQPVCRELGAGHAE